MTTGDHQDGSGTLPDFDSNVPAPPATGGKPGSKGRRWLKLVLLGVGLAGIYIAFNLSLLTVPVTGPPLKAKPVRNEPNFAAFKLTEDKLQKQLISVINPNWRRFGRRITARPTPSRRRTSRRRCRWRPLSGW
jgi:hypothetical protein